MAKNPSEALVERLCDEAFLALWSFPNPQNTKGQELCDLLVVCDPDIIIVSVKEIATGRWDRWQRKAIDGSVAQVYGAERWLRTANRVICSDGSSGLHLPDPTRRRYHRLVVALGSKGIPVYMGDFGKGFVYVVTDESLDIVMRELDTIFDFTHYLRAIEDYSAATEIIMEGSDIDLLATYLSGDRSFPGGLDHLVIQDGAWHGFSNRPGYQAKKEADEDSYFWDGLLGVLAGDVMAGRLEPGVDADSAEAALRVMARETRFSRRVLGKAFEDFLERSQVVRSRMLTAPSGVVYVFLADQYVADRELRMRELALRCLVARGLHRESETIVGIATEQYEPGGGSSFDVVRLHIPQWTQHHQAVFDQAMTSLGYFANPETRTASHDEYPRLQGRSRS